MIEADALLMVSSYCIIFSILYAYQWFREEYDDYWNMLLISAGLTYGCLGVLTVLGVT